MLILGLDQSITQTGWALYEAPGDERRIRCGSFSAAAVGDAEMQCDLFAQELKRLIGRHRPDFICWERARRSISAYPKAPPPMMKGVPSASWTVNADQLLLPEIQGIIRAYAIAYRIPYESVDVRTWRAAIYGKGGGKLAREAAKEAARAYCRRLGIRFANHNEAEAACIAIWAARNSQRFKLIQHTEAAA